MKDKIEMRFKMPKHQHDRVVSIAHYLGIAPHSAVMVLVSQGLKSMEAQRRNQELNQQQLEEMERD